MGSNYGLHGFMKSINFACLTHTTLPFQVLIKPDKCLQARSVAEALQGLTQTIKLQIAPALHRIVCRIKRPLTILQAHDLLHADQ